jgi:hypothetical protein
MNNSGSSNPHRGKRRWWKRLGEIILGMSCTDFREKIERLSW